MQKGTMSKQFNPTKSKRILLLSALLCTAVIAVAQPGTPPDPATMAKRRVAMLTKELTLDSGQQASALTIFTNAFTAAQPIQTSLRTNRKALEEAVTTNAGNIDNLAATEGTLTGQLTAINTKAEAAFYATLNATQQTTFNAHPQGGFGRRGPGVRASSLEKRRFKGRIMGGGSPGLPLFLQYPCLIFPGRLW
jgi:hypothetical protein